MEGAKIQRKSSDDHMQEILRLNLIRLPLLVSDLQNGHFI